MMSDENSRPLIGIWWCRDRIIAAFPHSQDVNSFRSNFIDSNLNHADEWPKIAKQFGCSKDEEYFIVPRGRVLWDIGKSESVIYHGSSTSLSQLRLIAKHFQLGAQWRAAKDLHYELDPPDEFFD